MNPDAIGDETPGQAATRGDPVSGFGVLEDAQSLWHELGGLIHDRFRLAALETQRAGKSLVSMTSWQRVAPYCLPSHPIC
jgi:hypothetical protein